MSDVTYTFIGPDGQQDGPHPVGMILAAISAGAIRKETMVWRSDQPDWLPAENFTELTWPAVPPKAGGALGSQQKVRKTIKDIDYDTLSEMRSYASWFWVIAVVTLIFGFIAMSTAAPEEKAIVIGSFVFISVFFGVIGFFAFRGHRWAFIVGLVFLVLDLIGLIISFNILGIVIRAYAVFQVWKGFQIARVIHQRLNEG